MLGTQSDDSIKRGLEVCVKYGLIHKLNGKYDMDMDFLRALIDLLASKTLTTALSDSYPTMFFISADARMNHIWNTIMRPFILTFCKPTEEELKIILDFLPFVCTMGNYRLFGR